MPISLEQPGMVSPQITNIYGAALQFSQDAPTLASLAGHTADMNQQVMARGDQMRLANAALGAQSANEQADRYWRSQAANADREQSAMNLGAQLTNQNDLAQLHANTQLIGQQRGAELAVWANGQELTQADQMEQQKLARTVGAIMRDENLGPVGEMTPDRMNMLTQVQTRLNPLDQKAQQAQIKNTEAMTKLHDMQVQQELRKEQAFKQNEIAMQDFEAKAKEKGQGVMRWADPETGKTHLLIQNPKSGQWENPIVNSAGANGEDKAREAEMKHFETDKKIWLDHIDSRNRAMATERARIEKFYESPESLNRIKDGSLRRATPDEIEEQVKRNVNIPDPGPPPVSPRQRGQAPSPQPGQQATSDSPVSQEPPAQQVNELQKTERPFKPGDTESMSARQRSLVGGLSEKLNEIVQRPTGPVGGTKPNAIPEEKKAAAIHAIHGMHDLIARYGWTATPAGDVNPAMSADDRKAMGRYREILSTIPSPVPVRPGIQQGINDAAERSRQGPKNFFGFSPGTMPLGR